MDSSGVKGKFDLDKKYFASELRRRREGAAMTQRDVAAALGVWDRTISAYESGAQFPAGEILWELQRLGLAEPRFPESHHAAYEALAIVLSHQEVPACQRVIKTLIDLAAKHQSLRR